MSVHFQPRQLTFHEVRAAFDLRTAQLSDPTTRWAVVNTEDGEVLSSLGTEQYIRTQCTKLAAAAARFTHAVQTELEA